MAFQISGRVAWKFGDCCSGDLILGRKGALTDPNRDPDHLKGYVLQEVDPGFPERFRKGDLMIAGRSFGMTRDHGSVKALKALGVSAIIAESFGRVWMRRAITNALPVLRCPGITLLADQGDEIQADMESGLVRNLTTGQEIKTSAAFGPQLDILRSGSLTAYLRHKLGVV